MKPPEDMRPDELASDDGYFRWRLLRTLGVIAFLLLGLLIAAIAIFIQVKDIAHAVT